MLAAQQHPELFHAYIGGAQMASQLAADQVLYELMLDYAAETGDTGLAEQMRDYGPPRTRASTPPDSVMWPLPGSLAVRSRLGRWCSIW